MAIVQDHIQREATLRDLVATSLSRLRALWAPDSCQHGDSEENRTQDEESGWIPQLTWDLNQNLLFLIKEGKRKKDKKGRHQKDIETLDVVRLLDQCFAYSLKLVCQGLNEIMYLT